MGQIGHGLHQLLISRVADLIQQQRQEDGGRKRPQQGVQAQQHRILNDAEAEWIPEKLDKIFQAHELAVEESL